MNIHNNLRSVLISTVMVVTSAASAYAMCSDRSSWTHNNHRVTLNAFDRSLPGYRSIGVEAKYESLQRDRSWRCLWLKKCSHNNQPMPRGTRLIATFYGENAVGTPVVLREYREDCSGRERCRTREFALGARVTIRDDGSFGNPGGFASLPVKGVVGWIQGIGAFGRDVCKGTTPANDSGRSGPNVFVPPSGPNVEERRDTPRSAPKVPLNDRIRQECRRRAGSVIGRLCP